METTRNQTENNGLNKLIGKLQKEDANYATLSRTIQIVYWLFIPLYVFLTIREFWESNEIYDLIGGGFFVLGFLIFAVFFGKYYKEYKFVDYSVPTIQLLQKAAWRYQPFHARSVWIVLGLVFIDAGLTFNNLDESEVLETQVFFLGVIAIAIIIGLILWYYKYKPLRDDAIRLLNELEGE